MACFLRLFGDRLLERLRNTCRYHSSCLADLGHPISTGQFDDSSGFEMNAVFDRSL